MHPLFGEKLIGGRILIVDDDADNRALLHDLLSAQGYHVKAAANGETALALVSTFEPQAILLDVMMPGLSGFDVCRRLKSDPATASIPVLLVTALHEREDRMAGIEAGANDFITKPIDVKEVELRTRNAVTSKRLHDQIETDFQNLTKLEELRDNLTHMIVHDMRSPLMSISGNIELLQHRLFGRMEPHLQQCLEGAKLATGKLVDMVSSLLDISRMESGKMPVHKEIADVRSLVDSAVKLLGGILTRSPITIDAPAEGCPASCDPVLIQRVLANLIANAEKFSPRGSGIRIILRRGDRSAKILVADQGPGIPPEFHARIFDKFGQVNAEGQQRKYSTGLGLTFCKLAVEAHGGSIGVESIPGKGSTFWFILPD